MWRSVTKVGVAQLYRCAGRSEHLTFSGRRNPIMAIRKGFQQTRIVCANGRPEVLFQCVAKAITTSRRSIGIRPR